LYLTGLANNFGAKAMIDHFAQAVANFKAAATTASGLFVQAAHLLAVALLGIDPVCAGYAVVAAVLFYRAWRFHKAGKPEHMEDCAIHGILAAFIAVMHGL
jgi:hypothetical protein